jgi:hypothetical protein
MQQYSKLAKALLAIIAILSWFALIMQMYLNLNSNVAPTNEIIIRYFSYFTLDTNLIIAICSSFILLSPSSSAGKFFLKPDIQTAIAVYILIVGITYNTILRFIWAPQGLHKLVDELEHVVVPVLFVLFWLFFTQKKSLNYKQIFPWLIYPFVYAMFVLIRGGFPTPHFYPYPFIDVDKLGLQKAIINSIWLTVVFLFISFLFVAIAKFMSKQK